MRATCDVVPLGSTFTGSPTAMRPVATVPWKPRNVRSGRLTRCTGMEKPFSSSAVSTSISSRYACSVGPVYQGISFEGWTTLSPSVALTGMICSES